ATRRPMSSKKSAYRFDIDTLPLDGSIDLGSSWALHFSHWQYPRPSGGEIDGFLLPPLIAEMTCRANISRTAGLDVQSQSPSLRWPSAPIAKYSGCSANVPFGI